MTEPKRPRYNGRRNRPYVMQVRTDDAERQGFEMAASIAGVPLTTWARERMRAIAIRELRDAGMPVPFMEGAKG